MSINIHLKRGQKRLIYAMSIEMSIKKRYCIHNRSVIYT